MQKVGFNPGVMLAFDYLTTVPDPVLGTPKLDKDLGDFLAFCVNLYLPQLLRVIAKNWDESMKEAHSPINGDCDDVITARRVTVSMFKLGGSRSPDRL